MSFGHHYYKGAAEAHAREVADLHQAATKVGRVEQWLAAVDYMAKLEADLAAVTAQRDRLAELLQIALDEYDEDECATLGLSLAGRIRTALAGLKKTL